MHILLKNCEKLLHCKSFSHFFNKKYRHISSINVWKFNETLTNDVVSFEQPGPGGVYIKQFRSQYSRVNTTGFNIIP